VKQQKGRIDILFANAGPEPVIEPLGTITENHFDKIFNETDSMPQVRFKDEKNWILAYSSVDSG